ncbi:MAG TPA: S1 RNA-binding domain-containing protein [Longimicrobium sp.]|nr:S1 RNA-binding domain-containing protein [Longimicrobium sp.]
MTTSPNSPAGDDASLDGGVGRLMRELAVGQVRRGVVTEVMEFGARVDLGGVTGLLLIVDMSWTEPMYPPWDHYAVGDEIDVRVLDIDWSVGRLSLGVKQLTPNPWTGADERYPVGTRVRGRVVSITTYGAFVELEYGVWALMPAAELGPGHPGRRVKLGDVLEAVVSHMDRDAEKIRLTKAD